MTKNPEEKSPGRILCWECGRKLWGTRCEKLKIDGHPRSLHIQCAKNVKRSLNFVRRGDESV